MVMIESGVYNLVTTFVKFVNDIVNINSFIVRYNFSSECFYSAVVKDNSRDIGIKFIFFVLILSKMERFIKILELYTSLNDAF